MTSPPTDRSYRAIIALLILAGFGLIVEAGVIIAALTAFDKGGH